jgi:hypothetical protein
VPRYGADTFVLSGAEDLVEYRGRTAGGWQPEPDTRQGVGISYTVRRYRPRIEGLFARIEQWTEIATGDAHLRSVTRDNVTSICGRDDDSRLIDPADPRRTFNWLICESYDDRGNTIQYRYRAEDGGGVDLAAPHEAGRPLRNRTAQRHWMFEIVFDYGEHDPLRPTPVEQTTCAVREDPFSTFRAGFEFRTYRRCRRILMFHHFPGEPTIQLPDKRIRTPRFDAAGAGSRLPDESTSGTYPANSLPTPSAVSCSLCTPSSTRSPTTALARRVDS